ncbi:MAG: universal stress protein [Syntrophobacteraceae bacterium]
MERLLVALDCTPECQKIVGYLVRTLKGTSNCEFHLFHILPTVSPEKLRKETLQRIERTHEARPDLAGYFWKEEDEKNMYHNFSLAWKELVSSGFSEGVIFSDFGVESGDLADIILQKAEELGCSTVILGRKRLSRVKEFILGSVSGSVVKLARGVTVWIIEN